MDDVHNGSDPVDARVAARDGDGAGIDIAGDHGSAQGLGCGDGKHAGAGADIEHHGPPLTPAGRGRANAFIALAAPRLHDPVERE
jgi:hypothetical protein